MILPGFAGKGKPGTIHVKKYRIQKAGELVANLARHISCLQRIANYVKSAFSPGKSNTMKRDYVFLLMNAAG
jgi:hypothetical protein